MKKKNYALLGIIGIVVAYLSIIISIVLSPWFTWQKNALSDLGHSVNSEVSQIFNFGLLLGGFLIMIFALKALQNHARYTSICLAASAFALQLVATFDEVYGSLHFIVLVLFFLSIGITSIVNAVEKKSVFALIAFLLCIASWIFYGMKIYTLGISVPEIISFTPIASLLVLSAVRIYFSEN